MNDLDELLRQWDKDPVQVLLGLPEVNIKETRRKLFKVLAAYRRFKRQIKNGEHLDVIRIGHKAKPGYEDAIDPDTIRGSGFGGIIFDDPHRRRLQRFIDHLDYKVRNLPEPQGEIIKRRYLTIAPQLPKDYEVFKDLEKKRIVMSEREYDREKREALLTLAESLGTMVFEIDR